MFHTGGVLRIEEPRPGKVSRRLPEEFAVSFGSQGETPCAIAWLDRLIEWLRLGDAGLGNGGSLGIVDARRQLQLSREGDVPVTLCRRGRHTQVCMPTVISPRPLE